MLDIKKIIFATLVCFVVMPSLVFARIGVAVGTGKIIVEQKLKPGQSYELPVLSVINNGDEDALYDVTVEYHEGVPELRPEREWFKFTPQNFTLAQGEVKNVKVEVNLPVKAEVGDYFAYLEGHPTEKGVTVGGATIGIAAAAKLYFTVVPANIFMAWYYKLTTAYSRYHPYDTIALALGAFVYVVYWLKKNFKFQIAKK